MPRFPSTTLLPAGAAALALAAGLAVAQTQIASAPPMTIAAAPERPMAPAPARASQGPSGRKEQDGPPTKLAFKSVTVEQIVPFIVEATGKVVMPQQDVMSRRVTVLNDKEIPRNQALDLVILALQQNGVAVVETANTVTLRDLNDINKQDVPVLGPDQSVLEREDQGSIATKVFRLKHSQAKNYGDFLKNTLPDYAKSQLVVDEDSNQIAVMGDIALLQRMERLITALDKTPEGAVITETFNLRYADPDKVTQNIEDLFSPTNGANTPNRNGQNRNNQRGPQNNQQPNFFRPPTPGGDTSTANTQPIRVTSNAQQNSVTVVADPALMEEIRRLVEDYWDKPLPADQTTPRVYQLVNSDPVKVRALLEGLYGKPGSTTGNGGGGGGGGNAGGQPAGTVSTSGIGRLQGQFSFQAIPEAQQLVVIAKSPDNFNAIDELVAKLDRPQTAGLPAIIELKHANSEDLSEQLNTLLSQDGTLAQITRSASGLTTTSATSSPFASTASTSTTDQNGNTTTNQNTTANQIAFWWQRSRPPTDRQPNSNLIGQVRIVPVWRQNAVMVMAPPEYKGALVSLIQDLDRPGRQVLISAVIVEVELDDALSLGLRWSSQTITPTNTDNSFSLSSTSANTKNNLLPSLFDTSTLNVNANLNVILQALAQKTAITIVSEPKIFTSDNQEASFFSGQDIPFITQSTVNSVGSPTQSFDYKAVGIQLNARPRITQSGNVDLNVNVVVASVEPGVTLFGGAVIDRRETTTQLIVKNKQTVVISGLIRKSDNDITRKIPLLGDIPIIGPLFRSTDKTKTHTELLMFITPSVVVNDEEMDETNKPFRERLDTYTKDLEKVAPRTPPAGSAPGNGKTGPSPLPSPPQAPSDNPAGPAGSGT